MKYFDIKKIEVEDNKFYTPYYVLQKYFPGKLNQEIQYDDINYVAVLDIEDFEKTDIIDKIQPRYNGEFNKTDAYGTLKSSCDTIIEKEDGTFEIPLDVYTEKEIPLIDKK